MGRWRASFILFNIARITRSTSTNSNPNISRHLNPLHFWPASKSTNQLVSFRGFSALQSPSPIYGNEFDFGVHNYEEYNAFESKDDVEIGKIPVKVYFLCTRRRKKGLQEKFKDEYYGLQRAKVKIYS